jgi:cation transport regulator ChaC
MNLSPVGPALNPPLPLRRNSPIKNCPALRDNRQPMQPIRYFAYGSNMLRARLLSRGVVLFDKGQPAQIANHKLAFNKKSNDGSSKANLMPTAGVITWGILFSVDPKSLAGLDAAEGAPRHYRSDAATVRTQQGDLEVITYFAQSDKLLSISDRPWDWYLALIIAGAKACPGIPDEWIRYLLQIGAPKQSAAQPSTSFLQAVAQLKAAGHDRWQDLLTVATTSTL